MEKWQAEHIAACVLNVELHATGPCFYAPRHTVPAGGLVFLSCLGPNLISQDCTNVFKGKGFAWGRPESQNMGSPMHIISLGSAIEGY